MRMEGASAALLLAALLLAGSTRALADVTPPATAGEGGALQCSAHQFRCEDGARCVPLAWRCDGRAHCGDASDELHCHAGEATCRADEFRCVTSGFCLAPSWRCDGDPDCGPNDSSDEDPYACQEDFRCPGNHAQCATPVGGRFQCVLVERFCDGERHCVDGSDEWDICDNFTRAECEPLGCQEGCRPTLAGPACHCREGYEPDVHGRCQDTDECAGEEACAQHCSNTPGSFRCACDPQYRLAPDNSSCEPLDDPAGTSLVLVTAEGLERVWLSGSRPAGASAGAHSLRALDVRAVDFHYDNRTVCYVHRNLTKSNLVCVDANDFGRRTFVGAPDLFPDIDGVTQLALDWVTHNVYLSDATREALYVCGATLRVCRVVAARALATLRGLALDARAGLLFWSVWGADGPALERATAAGGERAALVRTKLVYPGAVTLDPAARTLYWLDAYLDAVERVGYDGTHRRTVRRGYSTQEVALISVLGETLYLPTWRSSGVLTAARRAGGADGARVAPGARVRGALVLHAARQPPGRACAPPCAQLCLGAQCACAAGLRGAACARAPPGEYVLVARGAPPMVQVLALDGSGDAAAPVLHAARPSAADVDVAGGYVYYCDVQRYELARRRLDGGAPERFVTAHIDNCEGLAVDPLGRLVYWSDAARGSLSAARLDGAPPTPRRTLLRGARGYQPRSLLLDPHNGVMYWAVWDAAGGGDVDTADMDGGRRRVLLRGVRAGALALGPGALYWADGAGLHRLLLASGARTTLDPAPGVVGLAERAGALLWAERAGRVRRRDVSGAVSDLYHLQAPLYSLRLVGGAGAGGARSGCGGAACPALCLARPQGLRCACADGHVPDAAGQCVPAPPAPPVTCPPNTFTCADKRCVPSKYVCDGDEDCDGGDDEDAAPGGACANVTCAAGELRCDGARCVAAAWLCDGQRDCADGADEADAACGRRACGDQQFQCAATRRCVPDYWRCDAAPDCGEGDDSDEADCESAACDAWQWQCADGACVARDVRCDGRGDCADASDERDCASPAPLDPAPLDPATPAPLLYCEPYEFRCNDGECMPQEFRCDGREDCADASDEHACARPAPRPAPAPPDCDPPALRCDNATRCVPLPQQCDTVPDCEDGADEADRCGEPMCEVSACSHSCHATPHGPACSCPRPLALGADGATCERVACAWGTCPQRCEERAGRAHCSCEEGYAPSDGACKSVRGAAPVLLYSARHELRALPLAPPRARPAPASRALAAALRSAVALDWRRDPATDTLLLYWTDVVDERIYRGVLPPGGALTAVEPVVRGGLAAAEGLAVDWLSGNLYWVESALRQIEVAAGDGAHRRPLLAGRMDSPRALALDARDALLFWTDWESDAPRIERATLAGRERRVAVRLGALGGAWPNGLALDYEPRRVYWADARADAIYACTYDGGDVRRVVHGHAALAHPFALTVFEGHVYWTDWRADAVVRADKWSGADVRVVQRTLAQPFDLKVVHWARQPRGEGGAGDECAAGGGCAQLCLRAGGGRRECACAAGWRAEGTGCTAHAQVVLLARAGELLGLDAQAPHGRAVPARAGAQVRAPTDLHVDLQEHTFYWADTETNEIKMSNLTGGAVVTVVEARAPLGGLALEPRARLLYWAAGGRLLVGDLRALRVHDLGPAPALTALAAGPGALYWAEDARLVAADGAARHPRTLLDAAAAPQLGAVTSLRLDEAAERLYWVNSGSGTVQHLHVRTRALGTLALGARALDVWGGALLWAGAGGLHACDKLSCAPPSRRTLRNDTEGVRSLRVYDVQRAHSGGACALRTRACAHLCVPVSAADSVCVCARGHEPRGAACEPTDRVLLYVAAGELRGVALRQPEGPDPLPRVLAQEAGALAWQAGGAWLYWADEEAGAVWRVRRDGTGRARVAGGGAGGAGEAGALALDWRARNLYWSQPRARTLTVTSLERAHHYVLDTAPLAVTALAVDSVAEWVYLGGSGGVVRMRGDGSARTLLQAGGAVLALAPHGGALYWLGGGALWRHEPPGPPARLLALPAPRHRPVALALSDDTLYWLDTSAGGGSVWAAPLHNVTAGRQVRGALGPGLRALALWDGAQQRAPPSPCARRGCAQLCAPAGGGGARCLCAHATLAPDNTSCTPYSSFLLYSRVTELATLQLRDDAPRDAPYPAIQHRELMRNVISLAYKHSEARLFYSDIQRGTIDTVHFNGTGHRTLVQRAGAVEGMVFGVSTDTLYWTRSSPPALLGAGAGGTGGARVVLRLAAGARPRAIDFEPCDARLYWTDWQAARPGVRRASAAGRDVTTLVSTRVLVPNALALDHAARALYWADARLDTIERAEYDGSRRRTVARADHAFALAAAHGSLYWSDWHARAVLTVRVDDDAEPRVLARAPRPMAVVAVAPDLQRCATDPCATLNGGCAELCVLDPHGAGRCACGAGRSLAADGRTCTSNGNACPSDHFACLEGGCVPLAQVCDGVGHCGAQNASDESLWECTSRVCPAGWGRCGAGGRCVAAARRCDGRVDCDDGSDEADCPCGAAQYRCDDGACADEAARCDGTDDCPDGSDERDCPACRGEHCPEVPEAPEEDSAEWEAQWAEWERAAGEGGAPCGEEQFLCGSGECVAAAWRCDGRADCADGSDETQRCGAHAASAPPACAPGHVPCAGRCVAPRLQCDGRNHCGGHGPGADEDPLTCARLARGGCGAGEWRCGAGEAGDEGGACVSLAALCDGVDDCGDYSDEQRCNVDACAVDNGGCAHGCSAPGGSRRCWCRAGWRLAGGAGGSACADVDECAEDAPCHHACVNTAGSFRCACAPGHRLLPDGVSCAPRRPAPAALLFTDRYYVRRVPLPPAAPAPPDVLVRGLTNGVALDVTAACVYWSDVTRAGAALRRACPGGAAPQLLHAATLRNPDGLAVDWVGGNVYWCDKGTDTLEASRLDGGARAVLLRGGLTEPRALALHAAAGALYWTDWGARAHIGRAGMDGSARAVLRAGLGWPNALSVCAASGRLYFADAREDYIASLALDGSDLRVLLDRDSMPWLRLHHVFAVATWAGRVYWSDWETRSVESCLLAPRAGLAANATPGAAWRCRTEARALHKPMDLRVQHASRRPPAPALSALCAALRCAGLCVLTPAGGGRGPGARCLCPERWLLGPDARSCTHNCSAAHFVCERSLRCIPAWWRCDAHDDCGDAADEPPACPLPRCPPGRFRCDNGRCVPPAALCDGEQQCGDASDERDCDDFTCLDSQWRCPPNGTAGVTARCLPAAKRCDGKPDCPDGADEAECGAATCPPRHFQCGDGACVPRVWLCDADEDCADGTDEGAHCGGAVCARDEFRCGTGRCVPRAWRCDGEADCAAREDEAACGAAPPCDPTYLRCGGGRCVPAAWRCDGEDDCGDGADEQGCVPRACRSDEFRCGDGPCLRPLQHCDGVSDCWDGSDEEGCGVKCNGDARPCGDASRCVAPERWCDGEPDCHDGSDERECPLAASNVTQCDGVRCGARCVPAAWLCDGRRDCADGRDERASRCGSHECAAPLRQCGAQCVPEHLLCDTPLCDSADTRASCSRGAPCLAEEQLCADGRCVPALDTCLPGVEVCQWDTCPQLCLPKHNNYTCKCASGFRQRALPHGAHACELTGGTVVVVAEGGAVRVWAPHKEPAPAGPAPGGPAPEVSALAGAPQGGAWWVWWGDAAGAVRRRRVELSEPHAPHDALHVLTDTQPVRGVAVDYVSGRVYWTCAAQGDTRGAVRVAALDGRRRVTLLRREYSDPDDIVQHVASGRIYWSERGATPGVMTAGPDGAAARWLVRRGVRRGGALALDQHAERLYFVDAHADVLHTVRLDGTGRAALPGPAGPCLRLAVWQGALWCAAGRGVWRGGRGAPAPRPSRLPLTALTVLRAVPPGPADPCEPPRCHSSALCVRRLDVPLYACLCPDGLVPEHEDVPEEQRQCVISRSRLEGVGGAEGAGAEACALQCGAGECVRGAGGAGGARCRCPPLLGGARCQHARCAHHCHLRGHCELAHPAHTLAEELPPLRCVCYPGYEGERCERERAPVVTSPRTSPTPTSPSPTGGAECSPGDCLNGGSCVATGGAVGHAGLAGHVCMCVGAWGGARCAQYVGHDHACTHSRCVPPAFCVWGPDLSESTPGDVLCACLEGARCSPPGAEGGAGGEAGGAAGGAGGAWVAAVLSVLALLGAALAALYLLHRRRRSAFVHARLSDNVEINNPMYLAGEDEPRPIHTNGGTHFANPVYDSVYAPQHLPAEENDNLLESSSPPERAALL